MSFIQDLGCLRSPVSTYANLPIVDNVLGDLRICSDVGVLYTWMIESSSGDLTNWKKVTVSSYNDLTGRPSSTPLAIDDAITAIRNICLNHLLITFRKLIAYGATVEKLYDGFIDNFSNTVTIDETESENYKYVRAQETNAYGYFYFPFFNSNLDEYTKILMHGNGAYNDGGMDAFRHQIINIWKEESGGYFQSECIRTSPYGVGSSTYFSDYAVNAVETLDMDFTWDFWYKELAPAGDKNIIQYGEGNGFIIKKLTNDKIYVYLKTCSSEYYDYDLQELVAIDPIELEVTSTSILPAYAWAHIAIQRRNGYLELYINGVKEATSINSSNNRIFDVGGITLGYVSYPTWLDEVRYSEGIARYTVDFSPMTVQYDSPTEEAPCDNMVLQSSGFEANEVPTSARIVVFQDYLNIDAPNILPNEDLKAYVSRDGGTTFTEVELTREMDIPVMGLTSFLTASANWYVGTIDLSTQPTGKMMVWKVTSHNNKRFWIRSLALNWK